MAKKIFVGNLSFQTTENDLNDLFAPFGEVESVKTVSELVAPVSGTISAVNAELEDHPSLVNEDPYHEGWLVEIELSDRDEIEDLMDPDEYEEFVGE
jgi:glycine cleavage system H protein